MRRSRKPLTVVRRFEGSNPSPSAVRVESRSSSGFSACAQSEVVAAALESPGSRAILLGRIRSASSHPAAAALVRETVTRDLKALVSSITDDNPDIRAVLIGSHIVGIALARYVVLVEPLASLPPSEVADLLAPTFQTFLAGPLGSTAHA